MYLPMYLLTNNSGNMLNYACIDLVTRHIYPLKCPGTVMKYQL